jgi:hypothetical protein
MGVTAILFPGQGSPTPEMRESVSEVRPNLLSLVEQIVGEDPFARAEGGVPTGLVKRTLKDVELAHA